MSTYTIRYFQTDILRRTREIECASDDDALEQLAFVAHPGALELWQADRLVWSFDRGFRFADHPPRPHAPSPARPARRPRRAKAPLVAALDVQG